MWLGGVTNGKKLHHAVGESALQKSAHQSGDVTEVETLARFDGAGKGLKDVTFILKGQFICGCIVA